MNEHQPYLLLLNASFCTRVFVVVVKSPKGISRILKNYSVSKPYNKRVAALINISLYLECKFFPDH